MPMIDLYAPKNLFPEGTERQLASELTLALLHAEGVQEPTPVHLNNTAVYIHKFEPELIHTAAEGAAKVVRIQVLTPPHVLTSDGQKYLVKTATEIVQRLSGDETQGNRTWVLLTEAADGGWGIGGKAYDLKGFASLLSGR
ncbi:tautomerase family protein [Sporolactobacillus pectinivorans]|uniref:tautomerase family protein n=1 Tax=Sporolactobacillus pectinivorans TaxID=1591408 RepID=UPI000C25AD70|nr:4-oxalocrotonate tautomerase [Sporolactobacillus pectinivorans]